MDGKLSIQLSEKFLEIVSQMSSPNLSAIQELRSLGVIPSISIADNPQINLMPHMKKPRTLLRKIKDRNLKKKKRKTKRKKNKRNQRRKNSGQH